MSAHLLLVLGSQCDVEEIRVVSQLAEGKRDVRLEVVPTEAKFFRAPHGCVLGEESEETLTVTATPIKETHEIPVEECKRTTNGNSSKMAETKRCWLLGPTADSES